MNNGTVVERVMGDFGVDRRGGGQAICFARDGIIEVTIWVLFELAAAPSDQAVDATAEIRTVDASADGRGEIGSVGRPSCGAVRNGIAVHNGLTGDRAALGQMGAITVPQVKSAVEEI